MSAMLGADSEGPEVAPMARDWLPDHDELRLEHHAGDDDEVTERLTALQVDPGDMDECLAAGDAWCVLWRQGDTWARVAAPTLHTAMYRARAVAEIGPSGTPQR